MDPIIGQIVAFAFSYAPNGWAQCNGQLLQIAQFNALFALIGNTYGGDGHTNFALPDLRGKTLIGTGPSVSGTNYVLGQSAGSETVALTVGQIPNHAHSMMASTDAATFGVAQGSSLGSATRTVVGLPIFVPGSTNQVAMGSNTALVGGGLPHNNMQPYVAINYCIAVEGVFPPRP